jgi:hypothetical protein
MEKEDTIDKQLLIEYLKTLSEYSDINIIDINDIKKISNELLEFNIIINSYLEYRDITQLAHEEEILIGDSGINCIIKIDDYDKYKLNKWISENWSHF